MNRRKFLRKIDKASVIRISKSHDFDDSEKIGISVPPETRLALSFWALEIPPSRVPKLMNTLEVQHYEAQRGDRFSVEMVQRALSDFYRNVEGVIVSAAIVFKISFESQTVPYVRRVVREAIDREMDEFKQENPNWREM